MSDQDQVELIIIPNLGMGAAYPYSSIEDAKRGLRTIQNSYKIMGVKAWFILDNDGVILAEKGYAPVELKSIRSDAHYHKN